MVVTKRMAKRLAKAVMTYKLKRLIHWSELMGHIEGVKEGKFYVAVPTHYFEKYPIIRVVFIDKAMYLYRTTKPLGYRRFPDKFGRDRTYVLGYFEWKPIGEKDLDNIINK